MRATVLLAEVWAATWSSKVSAFLIAALTAAMCLTTLLTVGRSAAAEEQVQERIDSAGSRVITIRDRSDEELITWNTVRVIAALDDVETAVGLVAAVDVSNGAGGDTLVPARALVGDIASVVRLSEGRWPRPGEALIARDAQQALGMDGPYGYVVRDGVEHTVVGSFEPLPAGAPLGGGVVVFAPSATADSVRIVVRDARHIEGVIDQVLGLLAPTDTTSIQVESPATLAEIQRQIGGDLARYSRALLIGVLGAGAVLIAVVVTSDVLIRRADLGRRRALGATRATVLALVVGRATVPGAVGAVLGSVAGLASAAWAGMMPPLEFAVATAVLALLACAIASVPPAALAARRDPVRILRTP